MIFKKRNKKKIITKNKSQIKLNKTQYKKDKKRKLNN